MKKIYPKVLLFILFCALAGMPQSVFAQSQEVRNAGLIKRISVIFQDVASTGVPHFYNGKISNKTLIEFGITYNALRHYKLIKETGNKKFPEVRIPAKYVASSISRYFGKSITHQNAGYWKYRKGYYYGDASEFEQLAPLELRNLRVIYARGIYTAYAGVVDDFGEETVEKKKITLKQIGSGRNSRLVVTEYSPTK